MKAFNTTFAGTLASGAVGPQTTTVLIAGDDADAKTTLAGVVTGGGLKSIDAGGLVRARELEALGFLQISLAAQREGLLDRRLRRRRLTHPSPPPRTEHPDDRQRRPSQPRRAVRGDLERSVAFYQQAFDMQVMAREPRANAAFLRLPRSGNHHDLGLFGVGAQPPRPRGGLGLYHLAWQVDTIEELEQARHTLADLDAYTGESSHGATKSIYAQDPDGNEFEVMWMLPRRRAGASTSDAAPVERLDLAGEVRRWAGVRTAAELVPVEPS